MVNRLDWKLMFVARLDSERVKQTKRKQREALVNLVDMPPNGPVCLFIQKDSILLFGVFTFDISEIYNICLLQTE